MQSTPAIPPRPSRSQDKTGPDSSVDGAAPATTSTPAVPPRPSTNRRFQRSVSPSGRFAPSPLNDGPIPKSPAATNRRFSNQNHLGDDLERSASVDLPGPGEEGAEYAAFEALSSSPDDTRQAAAASPEQTRTVGEDIKLHAPKPQMPPSSAKERVAAVTRTDSDRAAAFGIGRPSSTEQHTPSRSLKKKSSTASQLSQASQTEENHGIPEIGQRVPMLANAGDVQAPSPAPGSAAAQGSGPEGTKSGRNHTRKTSSRGFNELPPGSYGLHGHGVASSDKLEKAYYEKHPEIAQKEHFQYQQDRPDFSMSSADLNKIVRDTASRGAGMGASDRYTGTPSEQVGFEASEVYVAQRASSRPPSAAPRDSKRNSLQPEIVVGDDSDVIHVPEHGGHKGFIKFGDEQSAVGERSDDYVAPILASDEVAKGPSPYEQYPAVEPPPERRGSAFEMDEARSRPTSRPASVYSNTPADVRSTPLDDVEEYEPLFPEDDKHSKEPLSAAQLQEIRKKFPSRDIWEDAPNSVHSTAEVSTPDIIEKPGRARVPQREGETPAQAFARQQEELAEKEDVGPDSYLHRKQKAPNYVAQHHRLSQEMRDREDKSPRFPSRDIWEDTPDSLQFTTTVSGPQSDQESPAPPELKPKPVIPERPKKQGSGDDAAQKPAVPARPKPQVPARPSKTSPEPREHEAAAKQKPAVPARPAGSKIAALQAGFMSDLNKRLQLGPQAGKKDEPAAEPDLTEEKEKAPLPDARKSRARGPQRRAPTKTTSPGNVDKSTPPPVTHGKPVLSFSMTQTLWSIDEEGTMTVDGGDAGELVGDNPKSAAKIQEPTVTEIPAPATGDEEEQLPETTTEEVKPVELAADSHSAEAPQKEDEPTETKTLATNTAGESVLEETIDKKPGDQVEAVQDVKDEVAS